MSSGGGSGRLAGILEEVVFIPTPPMRRVKAAYLAATAENPITNTDPSLEAALQVTGETRLRQWWSTPGFRSWFSNRDEFRQRVEYLANLALDAIEDILLDGDANPAARNAAAKLMIEAAGKLPKGAGQEKFADEHIQGMDRRQLEQFLRKNGALPGGRTTSTQAGNSSSETD